MPNVTTLREQLRPERLYSDVRIGESLVLAAEIEGYADKSGAGYCRLLLRAAFILVAAGAFDKADAALAACRELTGPEQEPAHSADIITALLLLPRGQFEQSAALLRALAENTAAGAGERAYAAGFLTRPLTPLGMMAGGGNREEIRNLYDRAESSLRALGHHFAATNTAIERALHYYQYRESDIAAELLHGIAQHPQTESGRRGHCLTVLGTIYTESERYAEALDMYSRALEAFAQSDTFIALRFTPDTCAGMLKILRANALEEHIADVEAAQAQAGESLEKVRAELAAPLAAVL